ncbi:MAG: hypothetical protein Q9217_002050 [Psora testacea]
MFAEKKKLESVVQELRSSDGDAVLSESSVHHPWQQKRFSGWRLGVLLAFIAALTVLLINVVFTLWAALSFQVRKGVGTIFEGTCGKSKSISLWLHLVINVFGTVLLSASNYCMQRLSAPSRGDIDRAHAKRRPLDIGIPSVRNFGSMGTTRKILWILLGASSVPLHLFYNSAIFSQLAVYKYGVLIVQENFLSGTKPDWEEMYGGPYGIRDAQRNFGFIFKEVDYIQENIGEFKRMDNAACIDAYSTPFPTTRGDLLVVATDNTTTDPLLAWDYPYQLRRDPLGWLCNDQHDPRVPNARCDPAEVRTHPDKFIVRSQYANYCLSREWPEQCKVQFSLTILGVVIAGNCIKAICMLATLYIDVEGLVTIGDAISNFLKAPDVTTSGMCIINKRTIKGGYLLSLGLDNLKIAGLQSLSLASLWDLGFGSLSPMSLTTLPFTGLVKVVLLVNLPQLILTFLFLTYNAVFTCELIGVEWNKFAIAPQSLRVTRPKGRQRSTHYLGLPFKYAIPLATVSATLHWFMSQSLFLANLGFYASDGSEALVLQDDYGTSEVFSRFDLRQRFSNSNTMFRAGYSCIAIICTIMLGVVTILVGIAFGFRRYNPGIPLVGSSSAAIAAACHPSEREPEEIAERPLMWGIVSQSDDGVAHCALSSELVTAPVECQLCAGSGSQIQRANAEDPVALATTPI